MAGVSISDFGASFIHYLPGVVKTLNNSSRARLLPAGKIKWEGVNLSKFVHLQRNKGVGFIEDGGAFPAAGKQTYAEAKAYRKFLVGSVQITDGLLNNASTTKHAAVSVVESELRGMMDGIRKFENFFFTRDGTGVVSPLGSTVSGPTITVDDARGLWDGKEYHILDTNGTTVHDDFTVSKVARAYSSGAATVTPVASVAAGADADDYVVWGQSGADSAYNRALTGLGKLINDASETFQNISTTTYPRYTSFVTSSVGTLTPSDFRSTLAGIKQESGEDPPDGMTVLGNCWEGSNLEELYEGELRLSPDSKVAGINISEFQSVHGRAKLVMDPDAPYGELFFCDMSQITRAVQKELDWRREGKGIFKRSDTSAVWTATALEACELFIEQRNRCGKMTGITETVGTAY